MSLINSGGQGGSANTNNGGGDGGAAGSGTPANQGNSGGAPSGGQAPQAGGDAGREWIKSLPAEYQENPSIKGFKNQEDLVKSYIHAQGMIGADKIVIPGKQATDQDWEQVFNKLGRPEDPQSYDIPIKPGAEEVVKGFKEVAHRAGLLPKQVKMLTEWNEELARRFETEKKTNQENMMKQNEAALKEVWPESTYVKEMNTAYNGIKSFFGDEALEWAEKTGIGNDPTFIKMMNKVGKAMGEDKIKGEGGVSFNEGADALQEKINNILNNNDHPYWKYDHPNHQAAVNELANLNEMFYRAKKK